MGSELSAASGRRSEVSEWPRSKFPASAVRQRRNFGHRNRVIGPYGGLQGVRWGGTMWASSPTESYHGVRRGGVKFSEFLGCCTGEGNGGGNGEGGEGIGENYKEV